MAKQNMSIKVSVIIPVYNSASTIRLTMDSLIKQTYHNIEIISYKDFPEKDVIMITS